jgi:hypothetical protein
MQKPTVSTEALISEEYRLLQQRLHEDPEYGKASLQFAPIVAELVELAGASELLDYGAGKGRLGLSLREFVRRPLKVHNYEPAMPHWSARAEPCRFVACIDVLEHVEPDLLDNVLEDLERVTIGVGFFTVHTEAAMKELADGRNAHLNQRPASWWLPRIMERFELVSYNRMPAGFWVAVEAKAR